MSHQFNKVPQFNQPLERNGVTSRDWYFFWDALFRKLAPGNESAVTLTGSPFTYTASVGGVVIVSGGTVSQITFARDGAAYDVGTVAGMFPINATDELEITYTVAPTVTFVPS